MGIGRGVEVKGIVLSKKIEDGGRFQVVIRPDGHPDAVDLTVFMNRLDAKEYPVGETATVRIK